MAERKFEADYASLCFLSYKRPQFVVEAILSAVQNAGYPVEVLVHDDGSGPDVIAPLLSLLDQGYVSHLTLNRQGHNEGVGEAIRRMFDMAQGDPVIKLDQDMLFEPDWLRDTINIMTADPAVGMFGFFKYNLDPVDWRKMQIHVAPDAVGFRMVPAYHYTRQFCGSGFAIPRSVLRDLGPLDAHLDAFNEDSNFMAKVRAGGMELALPDDDFAKNRGFGIGPSTVVEEGYVVHSIHHEPYVIRSTTPRESRRAPDPDRPRADLPPTDAPAATYSPRLPFNVGVVITTCPGREENLRRVLQCVDAQTFAPRAIVVVCDGCPAPSPSMNGERYVEIPKHAPGQAQPRNVGASHLREIAPDCRYVWFLDSDIIIQPDCLEQFARAFDEREPNTADRILMGPYEWLAPGVAEFVQDRTVHPDSPPGQWPPRPNDSRIQMLDFRWASFDEHAPADVLRNDLGAALANFSGNLIWPIGRFMRIGGFNIELHHGRCEDGELGLRACEHGIPMSFVREARGWHVWHPVDGPAVQAKNRRDVPLLNAMHPWVEQEGLRVVDTDGKRFDWKCPDCDEVFNTLNFWEHAQTHRQEAA